MSRRAVLSRSSHKIGADTPRGCDFGPAGAMPRSRHAFRLFTAVWGTAYLAEAAARVIIVETTATAQLGV